LYRLALKCRSLDHDVLINCRMHINDLPMKYWTGYVTFHAVFALPNQFTIDARITNLVRPVDAH
jgi:hypothetical protein